MNKKKKILFLFQFFDGPGRLASQIRQYCSGNMDYPPVRSSGNEAYILYSFFNVDVNVTFEIKITSVICNEIIIWKIKRYFHCICVSVIKAVCGPKTLLATNQTQVLTSPNYPQPCDNNLICKWTLEKKSSGPTPLVLRFTDVDLEGTKDCSSDYLEVYYIYVNIITTCCMHLLDQVKNTISREILENCLQLFSSIFTKYWL